jgi:hypothetical protein
MYVLLKAENTKTTEKMHGKHFNLPVNILSSLQCKGLDESSLPLNSTSSIYIHCISKCQIGGHGKRIKTKHSNAFFFVKMHIVNYVQKE